MAGEKNGSGTVILGGAIRSVLMAVIGALLTAVVLLYTGSIGNVQVAASEIRQEMVYKANKEDVNRDISRIEERMQTEVASLRSEISALRTEQSKGFGEIKTLLYEHARESKEDR